MGRCGIMSYRDKKEESIVKCTKCNIVKEKSDYYKSNKYSTGIRQPCKECCKAADKLKRKEYESGEDKTIPESKECNTCKVLKPSKDFHKRKDTPTGLRSDCKDCLNNKSKNYYVDHSEAVIERTSEYAQNNRGRVAKWKRLRYVRDPKKCKAIDRAYREANPDKVARYSKRWREANPLKVRKLQKDYYDRNRLKIKDNARKWREINKDKVCYYSSKRRAKIKNATPVWSDQEVIRSFYKEAAYFKESIDHIIPLSHPLVCGLHCEFNLQTIPLISNIKKNNTFEICEHEVPEFLVEENQ